MEPTARADALTPHGLDAVGAFVPVVLHDPGHDPVPEVDRDPKAFQAAGGDVLVLSAASGGAGDQRPTLDDGSWSKWPTLDRLTGWLRHVASERSWTRTHAADPQPVDRDFICPNIS